MTGVRVHHRVDGPPDAPVLVLSGSLGSDLRMWQPQVESLTAAFRVVRYDHRGHGRSPVPAGPYALDDLTDDLLRLLDDLGVEHTDFCGLSLGGMVGMQLAARVPERVRRLVLCCTSAALGPADTWVQRAATVRAHGMSAVADAVWDRWVTPAFAEREPALAHELRAMLLATPAEGYAGCCEAIAHMALQPLLPQVRAPTLVLAGADDQATPPSHGEAIAASIAHASLTVVPGARHLANVEQDTAVTSAILRHLCV